jgi:hypothetical protein
MIVKKVELVKNLRRMNNELLTIDMIAYLLVPRRDDDISLSVTYYVRRCLGSCDLQK